MFLIHKKLSKANSVDFFFFFSFLIETDLMTSGYCHINPIA
jgi:hypothetical protein